MAFRVEALMEVNMILNSVCFVVICYFVSPFANCFNLTQSILKLMINDGNPCDNCSWMRTKRNSKYREKSYIITTEDGYWLTYFRIMPKKNQSNATKLYPVLLHHGLLGAWLDWTIQGAEKSLAYQLASQGFDVWMGNSRGSTYAKKHDRLNSSQKEFWNFTFHELGIRDLSKGIDYILAETNRKQLIYVGHSQGSTILYVLLSSKPEYNDKILFHIGAAPIAAIPHTKSLLTVLVPIADELAKLINSITNGAFLEHYTVFEMIYRWTCEKFTTLCKQILFGTFGESTEEFNIDLLLGDVLNYIPAGTSTKNMLHWTQLIQPGTFSPYCSDNSYNISKITAPVKLFYGLTDLLCDTQDVYAFYQQLPNPMGCEAVGHLQWNHIDFLYGIDINPLFNEKVVQFALDAVNQQDFIKNQIQTSLRVGRKIPRINKLYKRDYSSNIQKIPRIPLQVMGKTIREVQEIVNMDMNSNKMVVRETTEHVNQILQRSVPLINDTIGVVQEPADFLKELEDFYKEIISYVN